MSWMENVWFYPYMISLIILLACYLIYGIHELRKYYLSNQDKKKEVLPLIYGLVFILLFIGRIFSYIFDSTTDFNADNYNSTNMIWWKLGVSFQIFAFALFFIIIEIRVLKGRDKYLLIILYFIFYVFGMITEQIIYITIALLFSAWIPITYLYVAKLSDGDVRKRALFIAGGIIIFMVAALIMSSLLIEIIGVEPMQMHFLSNLLKTLAIHFLLLGFK